MSPWFQLCVDCSGGGLKDHPTIAAFIIICTFHGFVSVIRSDRVISAQGGIRPLPLFVLFLLICFVCSATGGLFTVYLFLSLIFVLPFLFVSHPYLPVALGSRVSCCCCFFIDHSLFFSGGVFACIRFY